MSKYDFIKDLTKEEMKKVAKEKLSKGLEKAEKFSKDKLSKKDIDKYTTYTKTKSKELVDKGTDYVKDKYNKAKKVTKAVWDSLSDKERKYISYGGTAVGGAVVAEIGEKRKMKKLKNDVKEDKIKDKEKLLSEIEKYLSY